MKADQALIDHLINNAIFIAKKGAVQIAPHSRAASVAKRVADRTFKRPALAMFAAEGCLNSPLTACRQAAGTGRGPGFAALDLTGDRRCD